MYRFICRYSMYLPILCLIYACYVYANHTLKNVYSLNSILLINVKFKVGKKYNSIYNKCLYTHTYNFKINYFFQPRLSK